MSATITITCPKCKSQLKGPSDLHGKKVRCKGCGHAFIIDGGVSNKPVSTPAATPGPGATVKTPGSTVKENAPHAPKGEGPGVYAFISDEEAEKAMGQSKSQGASASIKPVKGQDHFGSDGNHTV